MPSDADADHDVIIVGAGPAGLAAGLYAARDRYRTVMLEKNGLPGGQIMLTERIENYPGYPLISGPALVEQMAKQCESFGAEIKTSAEVVKLERRDGAFRAATSDGDVFAAPVVILSPGSNYRKLGLPGEERYAGSGVSYCGTCDAPFFKDKHVVSVGGGNTAVEEALHLAKFCSKVTMVHRRREFRAQQVLVEELHETARRRGNIELRLDTVVEEILGDKQVTGVRLRNVKSGQGEDYACEGVFIFVGMVPNTAWLKGFVELDDNGFIKAEPRFMRTAVPGVFVAGDCRNASALQLATACGDGVVAAMMMKHYLKDPDWWTHDRQGGEQTTEPVGW